MDGAAASNSSDGAYSQEVDWSLFGCARHGHLTYAPDEPELQNRLMASTAGGIAWRCLRCGAFVTGGEHGSGPAAAAPLVRRGKELRSELIPGFCSPLLLRSSRQRSHIRSRA